MPVSILILLMLGWRESLVVAIAIPSTLALTLLTFYLYGFTLNRITLFALIFSIGILVDDAIVVVENIVRHLRLPENRDKSMTLLSLQAVSEVGNPTILATWAVIAAILPMAFVGGLMGPYMRPIPIGASAAMIFSLLIAFIVTPWAAIRLLKDTTHGDSGDHEKEDWVTRIYRSWMTFLLGKKSHQWGFLVIVVLVLIYVLMVGWFKSFITPIIVMVAIPFSLIGIMPAHGMMGAFFSATSMIGFMAGGGIVIRNSIILVDFIQLRVREGMSLHDAVIDAGASSLPPDATSLLWQWW